ncbi:MAG: DUF4924 family protein [Candidatus Azobacteroides sp.]|nr:DUF4924 family protein [Candidatus Azobacteroides sp.]
MLIANRKKKENIAEYLLYMWQIEDIIRAYHSDIEAIQQHIIDKFDQPEEVKKQIRNWYENLIEMMKIEQVNEKGHLQVNQNILIELTDLHVRMLKSSRQPFYVSAYYKTLPFIVELRSKAGESQKGELETCFAALYGYLLLKLQGKPVTEGTQKAVEQISRLLAILSESYKADREGGLEL